MRRPIGFSCEGSTLIGTIDYAPGTTGLLIVSGGNEVRAGAWSGQAQLAARIAEAGFPVCRFDRRGVGDSEGANGGYRSSAPDIAAAIAMFRRECPQVSRVVGHGNCDAASALMLGGGAGCDALVVSNPWTLDDEGVAPPPPEVVRAHYRRRLTDPAALRRLLTGKVSLRKLLSGLTSAAAPSAAPLTGLAGDMASALNNFRGPVVIPIAGRDRTGEAFCASWTRNDPRVRVCADATHSFVEADAREWLADQLLEVLRS